METIDRPDSIFNIGINSFEDVDKVINSTDERQKRIRRIPAFRIAKDSSHLLKIAERFKDAYLKCIDSPLSVYVIDGINQYHTLLKDTCTVFANYVEPFISALQSHHEAFKFFAIQPQLAVESMVKTNALAKSIVEVFEKLEENCTALTKIFWDTAEKYKKQMRQEGNLTLQCAIKSLYGIRFDLGASDVLWRPVIRLSGSLSNNVLANSLYIKEKLQTHTSQTILQGLSNLYVSFKAKKVDAKNLPEKIDPLEEVEDQLERSLIDWIVLAKIIKSMIANMGNTVANLEPIIAEIEKSKEKKTSSTIKIGNRTEKTLPNPI